MGRVAYFVTLLLLFASCVSCAHTPRVDKSAIDGVVEIYNQISPDRYSYCAGYAVSKDTIATAAHCIHDGIVPKITTRAGEECAALSVETISEHDSAVIYVTGCELSPLRLSLRKPQVGDRVYVIGHGLGFKYQMTQGIVSKLMSDGRIMTDAAVNKGNSGGPMLNDRGYVIGTISTLSTQSWFATWSGIAHAEPVKWIYELR